MGARRLAALAAVFALGTTTIAAAAPLEAYGRLPTIEDAALSADGARVAFVLTQGEARTVVVVQTSDLKTVTRAPVGARKIRDLMWAGNDHLIVAATRTDSIAELGSLRGEVATYVDLDLATGKTHVLLKGAEDSIEEVLGAPMVRVRDGRPVIYATAEHFASTQGDLSLFRVDLATEAPELVETGELIDQEWIVDDRGVPLAREQFDTIGHVWKLKLRSGAGWRTAKIVQSVLDPPYLAGVGRDGRSAVVITRIGDNEELREFATDGSDWSEPLDEAPDIDPLFDPVTGRMIGDHSLTGDEDRYHFFDARDEASWAAVLKAFPGSRVHLASLSADHRKLVVLVDSPEHGPAYSFVDLDAHAAKWIGPLYADVGDDVAPVRAVSFKASDGLALTGYLTVPKGRAAKDLPLVVFPHGGPADRDRPGFDWWAQAMASRGYAVLQVNYRGSEGFGWKFLSAGFGQYGGHMVTDVSDGVHWLEAQGVVDPKRVCIVGGSYGGYSALAGVTLQTGVYRCAVAVAGVSDMARMVEGDPYFSKYATRYWKRYVGVDTGAETFAAISPVRHIDQLSVPVLLIHGIDDTVVPYDQSRLMAAAARKAGKQVNLVTLQSEDHWLSRGETRLQMLQATMDFLEKNNPPG